MSLNEEFINQGNYLFKKRSFLPIIIVVAGIFAYSYKQYYNPQVMNIYYSFLYFLVSIFGLLIRAITISGVPKSTSGRNTHGQVADTLNVNGIYSLIRHPLYVGNFFMWLGIALLIEDFWFIMFFVALFWIYYERIMFAEEAFLKNKFGDEYHKWADKTPAIIPSFKNYKSSDLQFSMKNILKREDNGAYALVLLFTLFSMINSYIVFEEILLNEWFYFLAGSTLLYLINRLIRKYTNLYSVDGR